MPRGDEREGWAFQSTLPVWGATNTDRGDVRIVNISIHAPRVGSDIDLPEEYDNKIISIHAPRVGSDLCWAWETSNGKRDFNPRSPCGERQ